MDAPINSGFQNTGKRKRSPGDASPRHRLDSPSSALRDGTIEEMDIAATSNDVDTTNKRARQLNHSQLPSRKPPSIPLEQCVLTSLPPELLQHIFSFLDPLSLGRLLHLSKKINAVLDPRRPLPQGSETTGPMAMRNRETLWSVSRKAYYPGLPRPMEGHSELGFWRLIRGHGCQFCGKKSPTRTATGQPTQWNAGPGQENIRIIWPFQIRACGKCLETRLAKACCLPSSLALRADEIQESELLFSTFSSLMPAMPFAYFTPSLNYVTSHVLRQMSAPPGLHLTKYFFRPQMEELKSKFEEVRSLGSAAAEEWYKGLENTGYEKASEAARFEQWEASGGLRALSATPSRTATPGPTISDPLLASRAILQQTPPAHSLSRRTQSPTTGATIQMITTLPSPAPGTLPNYPLRPMTPASVHNNTIQRLPSAPPLPLHVPKPKTDRNGRDVNQMKAERRTEIERRCLQLDPPIMPSTLMYMDAFTAAMQIPMAMNDNAWELLKSRLLSQRKEAETKEEQQRRAALSVQITADEKQEQEEQLAIAKENPERDWDEMHKPAREKLAKYADEIIDSVWDGGKTLTRFNAPQFAADVLIHARKRFFEVLQQEDAASNEQGLPVRVDTPTGKSNRRLKLEHMKWVHETKIKPITDPLRRELFLCSACDHSNKYYALDAVIQHYAAKHTSTFSHDRAVVYWKADWPEESPFDPQPNNRFNNRPLSSFGNGTSPLYSEYGFASSTQVDRQVPMHGQHPPGTSDGIWAQQAYSPTIVTQQVSQHIASNASMLPRPLSQAANGPNNLQRPAFLHQPSRYETGQLTPAYPHEAALATFPAPSLQLSNPPPQSSLASQIQLPVANNMVPLGHHQSISDPSQRPPEPDSVAGRFAPPLSGQHFGIYHVQRENVARIAREVWDEIDGIDGMPDSVRSQVIISHVVLRFKEMFANAPNLALFSDALNSDPRMKCFKDLRGLSCRSCSGESANFHSSQTGRESATRTFQLQELLGHFQTQHIEIDRSRITRAPGVEVPRLEWDHDMVQLPDDRLIASLVITPGMTEFKLGLIAKVLPQQFPKPLPISGTFASATVGNHGGEQSRLGLAETTHDRPALAGLPDFKQVQPIYLTEQPHVKGREDNTAISHHRPVPHHLREDEYDPHRPAPAYTQGRRVEADQYGVRQRQEPVYARRIVYEDSYGDAFVEEGPYRPENNQPQVVYRYRDYDDYNPLSRSQQDYYMREPLERLPPRPNSRDAPYYSDRYRRRIDIHSPRQSLDVINDREVVHLANGSVNERDSDTKEDGPNDAEQFLNNFENIAVESYPEESGPPSNDLEGPGRPNRPAALETEDAGNTDLSPSVARPGTRVASLRDTPRDTVRSHDGRDRSRSPTRSFSRRSGLAIGPVKDEEDDELFTRNSQGTFRRPGLESEEDTAFVDKRRVIEYDQNGLPLPASRFTSRQPTDREYYRDRSPPRGSQQRRSLVPASPEFYRPFPADGNMRYAEVRPGLVRPYRYVDDDSYLDGGYEPVKYVRVGPRQARYVVEGPREYAAQYVEDDRTYRRDEVYERDGQLYTRVPERPYKSYEDPPRY